jgi:hypothetical protein
LREALLLSDLQPDAVFTSGYQHAGLHHEMLMETEQQHEAIRHLHGIALSAKQWLLRLL